MKEITKNTLFISREEAYEICDKSQYGEAGFWGMTKLNLRYIWCRLTRAYVKQNRKLTKVIKLSNVQSLNKTERELLIEKFNQELKNQM